MKLGFMGLTLSDRPSGASGSTNIAWTIPAIFTDGTFPVNLVVNGDGTYGSTYLASNFENSGTNYYVTTAGDDTTGDGSVGLPWRTIQKAINTVATGSKINVGAGRFANFTLASKNVSIYGVSGSTFVGDFLAESDITWGALSSGRQTATLASSTVSGFIDTTQTKAGIYEVSKVATTAAGIATFQTAGDPGVFRSTPSSVGTGDSRSLTGKADTEVIVWKATASPAFALSGTAQLYAKNISFVGGAESTVPLGTRYVSDGCSHLGSVAVMLAAFSGGAGTGTVVLANVNVRGCGIAGFDVMHYNASSTGIVFEVGCYMDQASLTGADNLSTCHGNPVLRINGTYVDAAKPIHDIGDGITGSFGLTLNGAVSTLSCGATTDYTEMHCAAITFQGTPSSKYIDKFGTNSIFYFYDQTYAGKSGSSDVTDRSGVTKPTGDATLVRFDPSNLATLFQDGAGTTPVTADGQAVGRINDANGSAAFCTVANGTFAYHTDGTKSWIINSGAANTSKLAFSIPIVLENNCNIVMGVESTDTSWLMLTRNTTQYFGDFRNGQTTLNKSNYIGGTPIFHVDSGPTSYTAATTLNAAMGNGSPHVLTVKGVNLSFNGYRSSTLFGFTTSTIGYDGRIYGWEVSRVSTDANLRVREQTMATKSGATLL